MKSFSDTVRQRDVLRLLDANLNRFTEGARVVEDIARFILDEPRLTRGWKDVRHAVCRSMAAGHLTNPRILSRSRRVRHDVGKASTASELRRDRISDILFANVQRIKESLRVLEEFTKLCAPSVSGRIKSLRYRVYELEKTSLEKAGRL